MSTLSLIGPMLGADYLFIEGEALHTIDETEPTRHQFWAMYDELRVERSDGLTFVRGHTVDGAPASATMHRRRVLERGPRTRAGTLGVERLLKPKYALIWGRPGEDWRLTSTLVEVPSEGERPDLWRIILEPADGGEAWDVDAFIDVDPMGRLWALNLPGDRWELLTLNEDAESDPGPLFQV